MKTHKWLPAKYKLFFGLGGWGIERTDQLFYLERPTNEFKVEILPYEQLNQKEEIEE